MSEEEKTPVTSYQSNNDFMPRPIRSIMPKGRSALPRGGGLSNEPVSYSNPVTNFIKGRGSLSGKGLLATGMGLAKGHSVLVPGGGLVGTSLFKMKHYDPYGHDKDLVTEVVEGKKSGIKKPAGDKHKDIDPEEKKHDDETTIVKLKKPDYGANTKTILEKTLENYEYRLKLYDTYDQSDDINDRRIATLKSMEIMKAELKKLEKVPEGKVANAKVDMKSLEKELEEAKYHLELYDRSKQTPDIGDKRIATLKRLGITEAQLKILKETAEKEQADKELDDIMTDIDYFEKVTLKKLKETAEKEQKDRGIITPEQADKELDDIMTDIDNFEKQLRKTKGLPIKHLPERRALSFESSSSDEEVQIKTKGKIKRNTEIPPIENADKTMGGADIKDVPVTSYDTYVSKINQIMKNSDGIEKTFDPKSKNKVWVVVSKEGKVHKGNGDKMKTKLKHVGVTSDIKKGQNTVKIFDKHEMGQAYLLSKEMLTKVLGIDEKKFMAMEDDDLQQRLLMLDFPDVPGEKKKKKKNVVEN